MKTFLLFWTMFLVGSFNLSIEASDYRQADYSCSQDKTQATVAASTTLSPSEAAELNKLRTEGFDALYSIDYATAQAKFEAMTKVAPGDPAGYFYIATNQWMSILNSMRRLQIGLYNSDSFYADTQDKVNPQLDKEFRAEVQKAMEVAQAKIDKNPNDAEAIYYLGASYGTLAGYEASVARKFISALHNGSKGVDLHRKVIKMDPSYADAYLSIGLYDYIVGTLPLPVKVLAAMGGVHGSRKRGLNELQTAVAKGKYASDDARTMLVALYEREGDYQKALELLDDLSARFPQNYLYSLERAVAMGRTGNREQSYAAFDELLKNPRAKVVADLIHYQYGESLFNGGDFTKAAEQYDLVTKTPKANAALVSMAYLHAGEAFDAAGQRKAALAQYQLVIKRENVYDSHDLAEKYTKKPYQSVKDAAQPKEIENSKFEE